MRITILLFVAGLAAAGCDQTTTPTTSPPTTTGPADTTTTTPVAPDNTAVNERDASGETKTPINQDEDQASVTTTAEIRKQITADETMSVNARNVKIVTSQGKVTLRGPVDSAEEKEKIEKIAKDVAGETNVTSEIEVVNR
jgi:hyperosmotically inducible protein